MVYSNRNTGLVLVDWDDVVMDRGKVRELQKQKSIELLGEEKAAEVWRLYDEVREANTGKISVDEFIARFGEENQSKIHDVFYDIDFSQCVDQEGWKFLMDVAKQERYDLRIFSEGSETYQLHKIMQSGLGIEQYLIGLGEDKIHTDKISSVIHNWEDVGDLGYRRIIYIDDRLEYLKKMHEVFGGKVEGVWMNKQAISGEKPGFIKAMVSNLTEVGTWLRGSNFTIEGGQFAGLEGKA